ncbi:MAG TPA: hypothetical protein VH325_19145 [Bryobacteraceae bacterium]|jgi:hypothetical protein|nr:hypothetical protein [Bryobacteraceae bacterium]
MTLEELQAQMDDHEKNYGNVPAEPDSDEFESENSQEDDSESTEREVFDCETYDPRCHGRSGGPRTPEGKAISSQNANKHGCRSKTLILRHEDPAEYEALYKKWSDHYQPDGHVEETLVKQLIDNHWFFLRVSKRMEQVDWEMPTNAYHWTETHQKLINNFMRYKTTAERAYQKSFRIVEGYFRDCFRDKIAADKADLMRLKIEAQIARKSPEGKPATAQTLTPPSAPALRKQNPEPLSVISGDGPIQGEQFLSQPDTDAALPARITSPTSNPGMHPKPSLS